MSLFQIALKISENDIEAPEWAPFGSTLWPSHREGLTDEEDTELEQQVYAELKKHFSSNRLGIPLVTANLLSLCMRLGWYQKVLHAPPYETLYRGIKLGSKEKLANLLQIEKSELEESGSMDFEQGIIVPYTNGYSSSWSFKKLITEDFSATGKKGYAVTFIAKTKDNPFKFIAGPGGLYNVYGLSQWHLEKETIGLEPIIIRKIEWKRIS